MRPRALVLFVSLLLGAPLASAGALHVDGTQLRDAKGGAVILRGVNVAGNAKVPPFRAITDAAALDPLPRLGFNAVRLLFTWEAYEPELGVYDDAYLAYYVAMVKAAAARGLYVIVDFHQDAYSRFTLDGCGEGFPAWTLPPSVAPATPDNGAACADWGIRMLGDATLATCWTAFYGDTYGVRTRYLAMIARVATALTGEAMVIGYDPINEPGGNEATEIAPFYEDAARAIRAVDPSAIVFVSPGAATSAGTATALPKPSFGNFVFAPHFYDPTLVLFSAWQGDDEKDPFDRMAGTAAAWGVPLFVGEYGAAVTIGGVDGYLAALATQLARTLASGAQWGYTPGWDALEKDGWNTEDFSIVDDNGALRANFRPRPYVRRVAGTPTAITFAEAKAPAERSLTLVWDHDPARGDTELFAPPEWFDEREGGVEVSATGGVHCAKDSSKTDSVIRCRDGSAGAQTVTLTPAAPRCGLTGIEGLLLFGLVRALLLRQPRTNPRKRLVPDRRELRDPR